MIRIQQNDYTVLSKTVVKMPVRNKLLQFLLVRRYHSFTEQ